MDFQMVADSIAAMTCVVSVEKLADGGCGEIRIVCGNRAYVDSIEKPAPNVVMLTKKFVPNSLYTEYLTRDLNFENACYEAAVEKKCIHSYAHPDRYDVWFNMTFLPLSPEEGNLYYCTYTMEITTEPSSERLSNVYGDVASAVLGTAINLREAKDFKAAMRNTVADIRRLCDAEYCCILLVNDEKKSCEILGEDFAKETSLQPSENYLETDFYQVAASWRDTISGSNCLIAKDERDLAVVAERNPVWYRSLRAAGIQTIALFPLRSRDERLGYMWATNFKKENAARIKEILELTTFVLGSETGNYLMVDRLRVLSTRDMLTGLQNRNKMNSCLSELGSLPDGRKTAAAVIFADLNGLKLVNDTEGHKAGDALLMSAASALREVFRDEEIFRAGGDEFVVLLTGAAAGEAEEKALALREAAAARSGLSFAIGCWTEADCRNVSRALMRADEQMYEDKKRYYGSAQHDRRRR